MTIEIKDEELIADLQQIAQRENRPLEDVLKTMVRYYPKPQAPILSYQMSDDDDYLERQDPQVRDIYLRAYEEARAYWRGVGDSDKADLTDEQMDRLFWSFDEEGVPRLKDEMPSDPPEGTLAYALKVIQEMGGVDIETHIDPEKIDDILNEEFADYIISRMNRGENE